MSFYLFCLIIGGTIDITVHAVQRDQTLKELFKANGGAWGGTTVDHAFLNFIQSIIGPDVMSRFMEEHKDDYVDLMREFEVKKRTVEPDINSKVTIKIPISIHELYREINNAEIRDSVRNNPSLTDKLTFAGDKLRVESDVMKALFKQTCDNIINHLTNIFKEATVQGTGTILMVGGFSESPMVRSAVETSFPDKRIIVPHEAGLAVLKGAVIFGHNDKVIKSRVSRYTYGIKVYEDFQEGIHPESKIHLDRYGQKRVRGVFSKLVEAGQIVSHDDNYAGRHYVPTSGTSFRVKLFASSDKDPKFVDDPGCTAIGEVGVDCTDKYGRVSGSDVTLVFGGTELEVKAINSATGEVTTAAFDFLN